jgi:exonuclease VII large subunit
MMSRFLAFLTMSGVLLVVAPAQAGGDTFAPAASAAREVARQLEFMQGQFAFIPGPVINRGLNQQAEQIQIALYQFRQAVNNKASKELIVVAFLKLDDQVQNLLGDLQGAAKTDLPLGYVWRRLRIAEHDLHFAVLGPGGSAEETQQAKVLYRQTLALADRAEQLQAAVRYQFLDQPVLETWTSALKDLRNKIAALQQGQEKSDPRADLKQQLAQVDQAWTKLIERFNAIPAMTYVMMQTQAVQVDAVVGRIDRLLGVENRRPKLQTNVWDQ